MRYSLVIISIVILGTLSIWYFNSRSFELPTGQTTLLNIQEDTPESEEINTESELILDTPAQSPQKQKEIFITDGIKHSIALNEILSGGPGKDGIPSIDNPKFISVKEATFLSDDDPGLGLTIKGESRFYPYNILVWHEIVNDIVAGEPVLVTYCPLCATGIVFERKVEGVAQEFGVSGRLWQSNLLMYNRADNQKNESLWSQVLGESILGVHTGKKLPILRSDVVRFGDWKKSRPYTKVLSQDTGTNRDYGRDPYGSYYTSESVSFGATFNDTRLHPKALVHGIEINGLFKAYHSDALLNTLSDSFAGKNIVITKTSSGEITITADDKPVPSIPGFWFSWLAVHPETELYK
ncbi:MAG: hypothetical protein COU06_00975 [Candidatus Harrisonbacteria bacterium CG10_big_fil_rev_8_21_14_0_10_38_8]|uniref:DUF3179 domain-containing protein n=1 Tax=Candidatus Harrisonbacteria bacterium CG10_big_fil_rev_8_21_14_0_10_38_8 TaxID=1974582 RepID=A0A2M6WKE1_9BACT|nr:MAG: hypothetical protein COU06_00975 [Candidatus Harrisonbacteria bacterium CG10_big_fil_rev_8_21_14_0_10_38_8]